MSALIQINRAHHKRAHHHRSDVELDVDVGDVVEDVPPFDEPLVDPVPVPPDVVVGDGLGEEVDSLGLGDVVALSVGSLSVDVLVLGEGSLLEGEDDDSVDVGSGTVGSDFSVGVDGVTCELPTKLRTTSSVPSPRVANSTTPAVINTAASPLTIATTSAIRLWCSC